MEKSTTKRMPSVMSKMLPLMVMAMAGNSFAHGDPYVDLERDVRKIRNRTGRRALYGRHVGSDDYDMRTDGYRKKANVGRNETCPCKSGKKYKKCCEGKGLPSEKTKK